MPTVPPESSVGVIQAGRGRILSLVILGMLVGVGLVVASCNRQGPNPAPKAPAPDGRSSQALASRFFQLEASEEQINKTVWAKEMLAQKFGRTFDDLWDRLNAASDKLGALATFPVGRVILPEWGPSRRLPHGVTSREPVGQGGCVSGEQWVELIHKLASEGWQLGDTEFRHNRFDLDAAGRPRQSQFRVSAHLTNAMAGERAQIDGDLIVDWAAELAADAPAVTSIDSSKLALKIRQGETPFQLLFVDRLTPLRNSKSIDPLILYDLDGDGLSEIILAGINTVYRRTASGTYNAEPLCKFAPGVVYSALIADFDGDGIADFLCENYQGLLLYKGSPGGSFDGRGRLVWAASRDIKYPSALTCGDIDHDGDLDVFLAQYKLPYGGGQMPTPYFDANDGYPAHLLINDGLGNFADATARAGLSAKACRRSYGAGFVDLDDDGSLDLLVASDFSGAEVYRNDGRGHFADVTGQWLQEWHMFGMAATAADFNRDGRLDFFVSGMPSATADRLEHLQLWRSSSREDHSMRARMTHGNRLYFAKPGGGFEEVSSAAGVDRSGWSWGCAAGDFDNDGFPDLYIANGMESRESVRDYEGEFWLHDAYVATSQEDPAVARYLEGKVTRLRAKNSYGGYDCNRLFLSQAGQRFEEAGHLYGVALQSPCRNVMTDDLDGDGGIDLIVTGYGNWPDQSQRLWVFRNTLPDRGNWIGFRFREQGKGASPVGLKVILHAPGWESIQQLAGGEGYRSQHSGTAHFGLGAADHLESVEFKWPNGLTKTLSRPAINQYHLVTAPEK